MMMPELNAFIRDGNQVMRSLADLLARAQQIAEESFEDHAGMSGERPELALQIKEPVETITATQAQPELLVDDPEVEPEPVVTLEEVRAFLSDLSAQGLTAKVRELIVAAGADKLSAVDSSKLGWLLERAKEIADGTI
ncbi:hypothetical protein [Arcanobacterium pinnipediorum]|uniref:Uncharacterized protein n=1 Tax=Arcanobacterium pinnipediorum TaxID=1503041 RepID=A0ABY5AID0_9ACTO|nr:hypothetical protein [Arcanobacterium pinnipediorum]USR79852.1 hypothetical protein NG665_02395 [Arcanobacterium pinnipediorum]